MNTNTIKLEYPITVNGTQIQTVTLRRPTVRDIKAAARQGAGSDEETETTLISNLSGLAPTDIDQIDFADYLAIQEVLKGFRERSNSPA
jgi:hypothetical protein